MILTILSTTALNSSYGIAVSSLIEYAFWQHKNKKGITCIIRMLNKLLNESKYEKIYTLFGMHLPAFIFNISRLNKTKYK